LDMLAGEGEAAELEAWSGMPHVPISRTFQLDRFFR